MVEFRKLVKNNGRPFTGNAHVEVNGDIISLRSYSTIVCQVVNGKFRKTWNGYSVSTARHIQMFCLEYAYSWWFNEGRPERGTWKAHWLDLPTSEVAY